MDKQSQPRERLEAETETLDGNHRVDTGPVSDRKADRETVRAGRLLIALIILFYGVSLFGVLYVAGLIP